MQLHSAVASYNATPEAHHNVSRPHFTHALTSAMYALAAMLRAATLHTAAVAAAELAAAGAGEMLRVNHLPRDVLVPVPAVS